MKYQKLLSRTRGFTLIELLVVIAIIGILASVVLASLSSARATARDATRISEIRQLATALELYRNQNNNMYPCLLNNSTPPGCNSPTAFVNVIPRPTTTSSGQRFFDEMQSYIPLKSTDSVFTGTGNNAFLRYIPSPDRTGYTLRVQGETFGICDKDFGTATAISDGTAKCNF